MCSENRFLGRRGSWFEIPHTEFIKRKTFCSSQGWLRGVYILYVPNFSSFDLYCTFTLLQNVFQVMWKEMQCWLFEKPSNWKHFWQPVYSILPPQQAPEGNKRFVAIKKQTLLDTPVYLILSRQTPTEKTPQNISVLSLKSAACSLQACFD